MALFMQFLLQWRGHEDEEKPGTTVAILLEITVVHVLTRQEEIHNYAPIHVLLFVSFDQSDYSIVVM